MIQFNFSRKEKERNGKQKRILYIKKQGVLEVVGQQLAVLRHLTLNELKQGLHKFWIGSQVLVESRRNPLFSIY